MSQNFIKSNIRANFNKKPIQVNNPFLKSFNKNTFEPLLDENKGTKISFETLLQFIEANKEAFGHVNSELTHTHIQEEEDTNIFNILAPSESKAITFLPSNLDNIFKNFKKDIIRIGVVNNHLSFLSSIFYCLKNDFAIKSLQDQDYYISQIHSRLVSQFKSLYFKKLNYKKLKIDPEKFFSDLSDFKNIDQILAAVTDYLHINVFVLNIEQDKLVYVNRQGFVPYKKNIFLVSIDDKHYEPLCFKSMKYISYDSQIIKFLLENSQLITLMNLTSEQEFVDFTEDLSNYTTDTKITVNYQDKLLARRMGLFKEPKLESVPETTKSILSVVVNPVNDEYLSEDNGITEDNDMTEDIILEPTSTVIKYDKILLQKKTVKELQNIADTLTISLDTNIDGKKKKKIKSQLIDEIVTKTVSQTA